MHPPIDCELVDLARGLSVAYFSSSNAALMCRMLRRGGGGGNGFTSHHGELAWAVWAPWTGVLHQSATAVAASASASHVKAARVGGGFLDVAVAMVKFSF